MHSGAGKKGNNIKRNCASSSGSVGLRLLLIVVLCSIGLFLALLGFGAMDVGGETLGGRTQRQDNIIISSTDPLVPVGFDCSRIDQLGIDKQMNFRAAAIMIAC